MTTPKKTFIEESLERFDKNFLTPEGFWNKDNNFYPFNIKSFIKSELERFAKREVRLFMEEIQRRANTIPPNLLLNEVVNYAYDRLDIISQELK